MKKILIVGATSAIAAACARLWANGDAEFFLVGRDAEKLRQIADDLTVRNGGNVHSYVLDLNRLDAHPAMIATCFEALGKIDIALIAHGTLPNQKTCENDVETALREFSANGLSVISLLTLLSQRVELQRNGTIAVISSVAGDRGRPSNYLYGTAKAAVSTFCEGLRARLFKSGVHVITIKPGFVDTPMTKGMPLPRLLVAQPEKVAADILHGIKHNKNVIYTPWFWRWIMLIIRALPQAVFKRINL